MEPLEAPLDAPAPEPRVSSDYLTRALRSQGLWLALTYVGLILLMARTYA